MKMSVYIWKEKTPRAQIMFRSSGTNFILLPNCHENSRYIGCQLKYKIHKSKHYVHFAIKYIIKFEPAE